MLSTRGAVLAVGAVCSALAGLIFGVEEFVFLALSVGVLLAVATVSVWYRLHVSRRALRVVVRVPIAEVTAGQSAVVELSVSNVSRRRRPPVLLEDPDGHWSVSYPGLGESAVARARGGPVPVAPTSLGGTNPGSGSNRRRRARDRRALDRGRRFPGLAPDADATLSIEVPTATRRASHARRRRSVV